MQGQKHAYLSPLSSFINVLVETLSNQGYVSNNDTQTKIENITFSQSLLAADTIKHIFGIKSNIFGSTLSEYISYKSCDMDRYIDILEQSFKDKDTYMYGIVKTLGKDAMRSVCIYNYLLILSNRDTDNEDSYNSLAMFIKIGKELVRSYLHNLIRNQYTDIKSRPLFSVWYQEWKKKNETFIKIIEKSDTFYCELGCKIIEILTQLGMIKQELVRESKSVHRYTLKISDDKISKTVGRKLFVVPNKLPMLVKPKAYKANKHGGYLLNDVNYTEELFINKNAYSVKSEIKDDKIYKFVNGVSSTPFKVNKVLLDFICNTKLDLLYDPFKEHEYANMGGTHKSQLSTPPFMKP